MFKQYPDIMSVSQVAEALHIGLKAAYTLVHKHLLGYIQVGRTIKVPKYCLEEFAKTARNNIEL